MDTIPLVGEPELAAAVRALVRLPRVRLLVLAGSLMGGDITTAVQEVRAQPPLPFDSLRSLVRAVAAVVTIKLSHRIGTVRDYLSRMNEKVRTTVDSDEETPESAPLGGPLSRLVEKDLIGSPETIEEKVQRPGMNETKAPADYARGTTEHDDDREE